MKIDRCHLWADLQTIRESAPLIHNITNYVVMEQTANSLLAIGASPVMAHAVEEVAEMTRMASCLVLNIGTLSPKWVEGMRMALETANQQKIPVILDPVGAGATAYRTETALSLLRQGTFAAIRGNPSEIASLYGHLSKTKGVDSTLTSAECLEEAKQLATENRCVVWMSGSTDLITDGTSHFFVHNGDPLMGRVTGMGCTATAITGAFLAVNPNPLLGAAHAALLMGVAGEVAAKKANGPGSFIPAFIDQLHTFANRGFDDANSTHHCRI